MGREGTHETLLNLLPAGAPRVGFGCGGMAGGRKREASLQLLETAFDAGVRYFDTARMYGAGTAECVLGEMLRGRRDQVILTSKAGILPPDRSIARRLANRAAVIASKAGVGQYLPEPDLKPHFGMFAPEDLRLSVETSLRQLGVDHLDILLLHELTADDEARHGALDTARELKRSGLVREYGLATGIVETAAIIKQAKAAAPVVQIPSSIWRPNLQRLPRRRQALVVTHSHMGRPFLDLLARLDEDADLARRIGAATGVDPHDAQLLGQIVIAHALEANPTGLVLFASSNPANIRANLRVATERVVGPAQIAGLVRELGPLTSAAA